VKTFGGFEVMPMTRALITLETRERFSFQTTKNNCYAWKFSVWELTKKLIDVTAITLPNIPSNYY
jgi:hypothetical protein